MSKNTGDNLALLGSFAFLAFVLFAIAWTHNENTEFIESLKEQNKLR